MDLKYKTPSLNDVYRKKAWLICKLYAMLLRMTAPRAIGVRYGFPYLEKIWPMFALSVAEHSFIMAQMIGAVYLEFLAFFRDKNIPLERLESEALHHDDAEALTGDAATDVDAVTRAMKDAAETSSISRLYSDLVCHSLMDLKHVNYEAKDSYSSNIVKMMDALDLIFFSQWCVRNGVGMICKKGDVFVLKAFGKFCEIDKRAYKEIRPYLVDAGREEVPISEIMYDHSLPRLEKLGYPELVDLFKLICSVIFEFPFEEYNLVNLPMDFANLT